MRFIVILLHLFSFSLFGQINYEFDYMIEYERTVSADSSKYEKVYYLTNSKNNKYIGVLKENDSLNYKFYFRDNQRFTVMIKLSKSDFEKADRLHNDCIGIKKWNINSYGKRSNKFKFEKTEDTIIKNQLLKRYKLSKNNKKIKKKTLHFLYYIIKESTEFHLPYFENPLAYKYWLKDKPFSSGVFEEFGTYSKNKGYLIINKLNSIKEINKSFQIPEHCEQLD